MFTATTSWRARTLASSDRRLGFYDIGSDQAIEVSYPGIRDSRKRRNAVASGLIVAGRDLIFNRPVDHASPP